MSTGSNANFFSSVEPASYEWLDPDGPDPDPEEVGEVPDLSDEPYLDDSPPVGDLPPAAAVVSTASDPDHLVTATMSAGRLSGLQIDAELLRRDYREVADLVRRTVNAAMAGNTAQLIAGTGAALDVAELRGALRAVAEQAQDLLVSAGDAQADTLHRMARLGGSEPNREVGRG